LVGDGTEKTITLDAYSDSTTEIDLSAAGITEIDIPVMENATTLAINNNDIKKIYLDGWSNATTINVHSNTMLADLSIDGCTSLQTLRLFTTMVDSLRLPNSSLSLISAGSARLTEIDLNGQYPPTLRINGNRLDIDQVRGVMEHYDSMADLTGFVIEMHSQRLSDGVTVTARVNSGTPEEILLQSLTAKGATVTYSGTASAT